MSKYSKEFKEEAIRLSDEIGTRRLLRSLASRITPWRTGETKANTPQVRN